MNINDNKDSLRRGNKWLTLFRGHFSPHFIKQWCLFLFTVALFTACSSSKPEGDASSSPGLTVTPLPQSSSSEQDTQAEQRQMSELKMKLDTILEKHKDAQKKLQKVKTSIKSIQAEKDVTTALTNQLDIIAGALNKRITDDAQDKLGALIKKRDEGLPSKDRRPDLEYLDTLLKQIVSKTNISVESLDAQIKKLKAENQQKLQAPIESFRTAIGELEVSVSAESLEDMQGIVSGLLEKDESGTTPSESGKGTTRNKTAQEGQETDRRPRGDQMDEAKNGWFAKFAAILPMLGFMLVAILSVLSLLLAWGTLQQNKVQAEQQKKVSSQSATMQATVNTLAQKVQQLEQAFTSQQREQEDNAFALAQVHDTLRQLNQQMDKLARQRLDAPRHTIRPAANLQRSASETSARLSTPARPKTVFPISVANYLRDKKSLPRFRVGGHLGLEEYEHGSFVIVLDGEEIWAIPFAERFESSYDFDNVRNYYDCPKPSGGEVILLRPARVTEDSTGVYHLNEKGELKIERSADVVK